MEIDKTTPMPLYYQLGAQIRGRIGAGQLKPGDQIPSERALGASLGWLVNVLDPQSLNIGGGLGSATGLY